ncbi:MAG: folylpolyglutamate synthase/dihydrofolate synthase family protein [candidate division Zixibacteria bacterium]
MSKISYKSAERFLLSREFFGMKLGLENITEFLQSIKNPQNEYLTIHISGTNGKGSTAAMLAAVLQAQGYKTGLFTSPHLVDFKERIKVNGHKILRKSLVSFVGRHKMELVKRKLSFFETVTALALDYFKKCKVEIAVIETGLGGRLDATNVLNPALTITTEIALDHIDILGKTIPKISREKAGIIKPGRPHLIGELHKDAVEVMINRCALLNAPIYKLQRKDYCLSKDSRSLSFNDGKLHISNISPSLEGVHQSRNAALVIKAVSVLRQNKIYLTKKAIREGLASTVWPARFQVMTHKNRLTVILDVAHNSSGVRAFVDSFKLRFAAKKTRVIAGFVKDKKHEEILKALFEVSSEFAFVPLKSKRSADIDKLIAETDFKDIPVSKFGSVGPAFRNLRKDAAPDDIITIIGSHYLIGEFVKLFGEKWIKAQNKSPNQQSSVQARRKNPASFPIPPQPPTI